MKRKHKIPTGWTKIWFTCCAQCAFNAHQFFTGGGFEVSEVSRSRTFRVKLRRWEAIKLLNMTGEFTNDKEATKNVYQAIGR